MDWIEACHEGTPRGRARGLNVVLMQAEAISCQGVQVGRRNLLGTVKADVAPALRKRTRAPHREIGALMLSQRKVLPLPEKIS